MAKTKAKADVLFDDDEFLIPEDMIGKYDLAHTYWMKFFRPKEPHKPGEKKAVMERYNQIADAINKQRPGTIIKLTMSTQWIPTKMYEGDDGMEQPEPTVKAPKVATQSEGMHIAKEVTPPAKKGNSKAHTPEPVTSKKNGAAPAVKPEPVATGGGSIIQQILALHKQGLSNKEIIAKGFNKSTVARQVSEYKKREGTA